MKDDALIDEVILRINRVYRPSPIKRMFFSLTRRGKILRLEEKLEALRILARHSESNIINNINKIATLEAKLKKLRSTK